MSNPTSQTPEQKEAYWLGRIVKKANSVFPPFIKELEEIVGMANHALTDENKRKVRILIANALGQPLTKLDIKDETPPQPPVPAPTKSAGAESENDQKHLRGSVLPNTGGADDSRPSNPDPTQPSGS